MTIHQTQSETTLVLEYLLALLYQCHTCDRHNGWVLIQVLFLSNVLSVETDNVNGQHTRGAPIVWSGVQQRHQPVADLRCVTININIKRECKCECE